MRVHTGAVVEACVIMDNCDIGRRAKVRRAILDKNVAFRQTPRLATTSKRIVRADGM